MLLFDLDAKIHLETHGKRTIPERQPDRRSALFVVEQDARAVEQRFLKCKRRCSPARRSQRIPYLKFLQFLLEQLDAKILAFVALLQLGDLLSVRVLHGALQTKKPARRFPIVRVAHQFVRDQQLDVADQVGGMCAHRLHEGKVIRRKQRLFRRITARFRQRRR